MMKRRQMPMYQTATEAAKNTIHSLVKNRYRLSHLKYCLRVHQIPAWQGCPPQKRRKDVFNIQRKTTHGCRR